MRVKQYAFEDISIGMTVRSYVNYRVIGTIVDINLRHQNLLIVWDVKNLAPFEQCHDTRTRSNWKDCYCEVVSTNNFFIISEGKGKQK